jgi:hypothetical protein
VYYSPVAVLPQAANSAINSIYVALAKNDPWSDENNPPIPTQDQQYLKNFMKRIFVAKKVNISDISPVISRINWTTGTVYDYYQDTVNMQQLDGNGFPVYQYYIKNKYDQVFKCLWNNNGAASTVEPYFEPGTFSSTNIFQSTDNYKWKYIYTIDLAAKVKFLDSVWMPVPVGKNSPNPLLYSAGVGNIDVINVTNGGSSYDPTNAAITITVTGDGLYANATANVVNGAINDILVANTGSNYTYANVTISSSKGSGAVAISPVSPIGGHGTDPISELGAAHVMITAQFNAAESGVIPTDVLYHQIGILLNPVAYSTTPNPANASIYKTTTDLVVASGAGTFSLDETIYQGSTLATATFTASMLSFDSTNNIVHLINTTGTPAINSTLKGNSSGVTRTVLSYTTPDFVSLSGYVTFIENRTGVQRSVDGIEQYRIVIGY